MKTSLKTLKRILQGLLNKKASNDKEHVVNVISTQVEICCWLEDFEAELRSERDKCIKWLHADGRLVRPMARYRLIQEILCE